MADVRDTVDFNEQDMGLLSFNYDNTIVQDTSHYDMGNGSTQTGMVVAMVSDATVGLGASGDFPLGKLVKVETTKCTVQYRGTMQLPYLVGSVPTIGRGITIDGAGNAQQAAGGARGAVERGIVLSLDTTNHFVKVYFP